MGILSTGTITAELERYAGWVTTRLSAWCRRKKDHGRAEAMLIAAWALGLRIERETESVIVVPPAESKDSSEDAEDMLQLEEELEEAC